MPKMMVPCGWCKMLLLLLLLATPLRAQICAKDTLDATVHPSERFTHVGYRGVGVLPDPDADLTSNADCIITAEEIQRAPYNVRPDDGIDDSVGIQAAIDFIKMHCESAASFSQRSLIELPAGIININTEIHLDANFMVLRGQGNSPDRGHSSFTKIEFSPGPDTVYDYIRDFQLIDMKADQNANGGWIWPGRGAFRVQTRQVHDDYEQSYEKAASNRKDFYQGSVNFHWKSGVNIAQTACKGSTVIELAEANTGMEVGDYVWVGAANSDDMYEDQGVQHDDRRCGHMRQQMFVVTSVTRGSIDTITIDKPLEFDLYPTSTADRSRNLSCSGQSNESKVVKLTVMQGVGLEDFYLTQIMPGYSASDADFNYNNIAHEKAMHGIVFKWAINSYARNVRTYMTGSHPIVTEIAKNVQFEGNVLEGSWNKGKGGNGYFRNSKVWDSLIKGNFARNIRHLTLQWSASGNLVTENNINCDINLHGGWERYNLIERNVVRMPYEHRDCNPDCDNEDISWYPIWWAAGYHAGGWSGASGPRNIFFNNILEKQVTPGGPLVPYGPYGDNPTTVFQFGWDQGGLVGFNYAHLSIGGQKIDTWTGKEQYEFWASDGTGVNADCLHSGNTLVGYDFSISCSTNAIPPATIQLPGPWPSKDLCMDGTGIQSGDVCCPIECGQCGGTGCSELEGGEDSCCTSSVLSSGVSCEISGPPCILSVSQCSDGIQNGEACCPLSCGSCGGGGCGLLEGGPDECCVSNILDSGVTCDEKGPPCIIPSPHCSDGIQNGDVCCPLSCGRCAGTGCGQLDGGADNCCGSKILDSGIFCDVAGPPCIVPPAESQ